MTATDISGGPVAAAESLRTAIARPRRRLQETGAALPLHTTAISRVADRVAARFCDHATCAVEHDSVDANRALDVLDPLLADVEEGNTLSPVELLLHGGRYADAPRLGQRLEPRRDVHAIAGNVVAVDHDVAQVDADPVVDALVASMPALRSPIVRWIASPASNAATALGNSARRPSPAVFTSGHRARRSRDRRLRHDRAQSRECTESSASIMRV